MGKVFFFSNFFEKELFFIAPGIAENRPTFIDKVKKEKESNSLAEAKIYTILWKDLFFIFYCLTFRNCRLYLGNLGLDLRNKFVIKLC
jgi:hypothetical protein